MKNILEVKGITKNFKEFKLDNISFNLHKGYIMGLIGPNGAGKTTLIRLIMNLINKDGGDISIFGMDNITHGVEIKNRIGFLLESDYLYKKLNLEKMKNLIKPFYKGWDDNTFYNYIEQFNLPLKIKIRDLSKGMYIKYSLALALSHKAELIILDEPTSGLDPVFRREFLNLLPTLIESGEKSILFSTHITTDLERIADYITFLNGGKLIFSDEYIKIYDRYSIIKGDKKYLNEELKKNLLGYSINSFSFEGLTDQKLNLLKSYNGNDFIFEKASLEDIMYYSIHGVKENV